VLGKIELPDSSRRKGTKPVASSDDKKAGKKKKRKRIIVAGPEQGGNQNQGQSVSNPQARPIQHTGGGGGGYQGNRPGQRPGGGGPGGTGGRGQRNAPGPCVEKAEVTDKEIQEQIKATLAKLSGGKGGGGNRAKYRREKRSAIADATEERRLMEHAESKTLRVTEFVSANDLASLMNVSVNEVIKVCMQLGMFVSINQSL